MDQFESKLWFHWLLHYIPMTACRTASVDPVDVPCGPVLMPASRGSWRMPMACLGTYRFTLEICTESIVCTACLALEASFASMMFALFYCAPWFSLPLLWFKKMVQSVLLLRLYPTVLFIFFLWKKMEINLLRNSAMNEADENV